MTETYLLVISIGTTGTFLGTVWLCAKAGRVSTALTASGEVTAGVAAQSHEAFVSALARIETDVMAAKKAALRTDERINVGVELGFQNAEAGRRSEGRDAVVAHDLADAISRADATPNDGAYGAAADAALRSPCDTPTEDPNV